MDSELDEKMVILYQELITIASVSRVVSTQASLLHWSYQGLNFGNIHEITKEAYEYTASFEDTLNEAIRTKGILFNFDAVFYMKIGTTQYINKFLDYNLSPNRKLGSDKGAHQESLIHLISALEFLKAGMESKVKNKLLPIDIQDILIEGIRKIGTINWKLRSNIIVDMNSVF